MQFIPKTHLPLREAVDQVADIHQGVDSLTAALAKRKLHADLVALEHRAAVARRRGEPLSEAEDAQLAELRRRRREREDAERFAQAVVRQALGDGDLPNEIMLASGRLTPVWPEAWRTNDAPLAFESGRLRWRYGSWQAQVIEGPVMIPKAAFAAWLRPSAKPDAAPSPPAATAAAENPAVPPLLRTGAPGRPTSMHLIRAEHSRRLAAKEACASVSAEASHLAGWLRAAHPAAPPVTPKTIENGIREAHRSRPSNP
jgi:hypothetical protein